MPAFVFLSRTQPSDRAGTVETSPDTPEAPSGEAIWLARLLVTLMPEEPEPKGLPALMLYCTARHSARRDHEGGYVPLERQDARL